MTKTIDLFEEHEYAVNLSHTDPGDLGPGRLCFGANKWANVVLQDSTNTRSLAEGTRWPVVKAKTVDGISFTLFDCEIKANSFYADYVVLGDLEPGDLRKITIRYTDVPEWLANCRRIEGALGDKLTWSNNPKPIAVNLPSEQMTIGTEYVARIDQKGEDHILHQHIEFVVEKTSGAFTLEDVQRTALEIPCLFSILLEHPVSLVSVAVVPARGSPRQVYFPGLDKNKKSLSNDGYMTKCFIQARDIEDRWQTIFENYYKSAIRRLIWMRFSGMKRYDSFWEYRVFGYVALLDQYVTQATNGTTKGITTTAKKKSARVSFADRFKETLNKTDADIAKIIGLAGVPFDTIKRLRDAIAHGDDPKLVGKDYTPITAIIAKIEILLTYWAFMDFGLTNADFLKCLTNSHGRLRFASQLDEVHLDRTTGHAVFFSVSEDKFREIAETKNIRIDPCFVIDSNGELHYSEHYRTKYRDWLKASNTSGGTFHADLFGVPTDSVRYSGKVYIESGANQLQLYSVYIFDGTKLRSS